MLQPSAGMTDNLAKNNPGCFESVAWGAPEANALTGGHEKARNLTTALA